MSARAKAVAPDAAIEAIEAAIDVAVIGMSWTTDRIMPMVGAILALAEFSSESAGKGNERLALICKVATEAGVLMNDAENYFSTELRALKEKLALLESQVKA